jgi:hypothetical protein
MVAGGIKLKLWLSLARSFYMSAKTDAEFSQALEHFKTPCPLFCSGSLAYMGGQSKKHVR